MTHDDLKAALHVFGLGERSTLQESKAQYRKLAKRYHPDGRNRWDTGEIYRVNESNRVIMGYEESYRICFSDWEFIKQNSED